MMKYVAYKDYKYVNATGGENGKNGYYDADYENTLTGACVRMVERDVFDFGCYSYPKRCEGTPEALNQSTWTPEEINAAKWIAEFGKFQGIRM